MVNLAAVAALALLAAGPALAGDRGGGHPGGGCGSRCGGGGHRPPPPPGGGFNSNINVNVNANANANANAFAGGSAGSYFNARAYDMGGFRGGGYGGGTVYVGGGYGGDGGGYYGGGAVYNEEVYEGRTCASAPFGYVVAGFGRSERRPPACVATTVCRDREDRGGRYGYSERRGCDGGRRESRYEESSSYERYESYEEYGSYSGGYSRESEYGVGDYERGYIDGSRSCGGGCRPDGHGGSPYPPPYLPEPPRYEPPARPDRPHRPRPSQPPRQHYSQEWGERG
ncbi:MAG: hypothetical protein Q8O54_02855 [Brevundimonas sp.]|nr:hypothetical protein [Brevundimonas sp.]